ncbi:hypothetical protein OG21DRAFT_1607208 [Imleria badia]|nr:hypothetical protein OG21DRAFT_1607208 [Imleria badia]
MFSIVANDANFRPPRPMAHGVIESPIASLITKAGATYRQKSTNTMNTAFQRTGGEALKAKMGYGRQPIEASQTNGNRIIASALSKSCWRFEMGCNVQIAIARGVKKRNLWGDTIHGRRLRQRVNLPAQVISKRTDSTRSPRRMGDEDEEGSASKEIAFGTT